MLCGISFWQMAVHSQAQDITCDNGSGEYSARFSTGVTVEVESMREGSFAERTCAAKLVSKGQEIHVASDVGQVGIDVLGADLGFGSPVVAFQIDTSGAGFNRTYQIYSLSKSPQLLYTITGGSSYRAADTDMHGHIEIWTDDAAAVDNFERGPSVDFDSPPTVVLRFEKGRLVDVGAEFLSYYDDQIAKLRSQVNQQDLAEFKRSDGHLYLSSLRSGEDLHRLVQTKISVLEIVWAYLYSGREHEAWSALADMWPVQDIDRIRTAVSSVHERGILRNVVPSRLPPQHGHEAKIYDAVNASTVVELTNSDGGVPVPVQVESPITQPKSILLRRPPPSSGEPFPSANEMVELVIDAAGKVHSAKVINGTDEHLVKASAGWQFIPAFRYGRPVACRFRLNVSTLR